MTGQGRQKIISLFLVLHDLINIQELIKRGKKRQAGNRRKYEEPFLLNGKTSKKCLLSENSMRFIKRILKFGTSRPHLVFNLVCQISLGSCERLLKRLAESSQAWMPARRMRGPVPCRRRADRTLHSPWGAVAKMAKLPCNAGLRVGAASALNPLTLSNRRILLKL